jgi:hypothetical protein
MPKPKKGESKKSYISRCIPMVIGEGKPPKEAAGKCYGMFDFYKKKKKKKKNESFEFPKFSNMNEDTKITIWIYYRIVLNGKSSKQIVHKEDAQKLAKTLMYNWPSFIESLKVIEFDGKRHTEKEIDVWINGTKIV